MLPPLLVDVNIPVAAIQFLRNAGIDVLSASEVGWGTSTDVELLDEATPQERYVLTQDKDFGKLVIADGLPFHGILLLRPGDDLPNVVVQKLDELNRVAFDWPPRCIVIYRAGKLRIRRIP